MTIAAAAMRGAQKAFIRNVDFYPDSANANRAASAFPPIDSVRAACTK